MLYFLSNPKKEHQKLAHVPMWPKNIYLEVPHLLLVKYLWKTQFYDFKRKLALVNFKDFTTKRLFYKDESYYISVKQH